MAKNTTQGLTIFRFWDILFKYYHPHWEVLSWHCVKLLIWLLLFVSFLP